MMSYHPAVPPSHAVHHPRTPRRPTQEKGRLTCPIGSLVSQGIGHGGNPAKSNNRPCPLINMCSTQPGASQGQFQPYTHLLGPPPLLKWYCTPRSGTTGHAFHPPRTAYLRLRSSPPPGGFSIPPFAMYDVSSDPYDHMLHYNQAMILSTGDDRLLCKVFPASLKGPVFAWFHKLPRESINTFSQLWTIFVSQYLCSVRQKGNISSLQSILKREEESIRDFTRRFGQAVQQIDMYSMDAVLQNFRRSFGPTTPFFQSLSLDPPVTMEELYRRADKFSTLEDNIRAASQTVMITTQNNKSASKGPSKHKGDQGKN